MGVRGELFTTKVALQNRTYFFNVKENRMGDLYLNVVESKNKDAGGFDRQSIILFADDLQEFLTGFDESLRVMEKAMREKRKTSDARRPPKPNTGRKDQKDRENSHGRRVVSRKGGDGQGRKPPGDRPRDKPRKRVVKRQD